MNIARISRSTSGLALVHVALVALPLSLAWADDDTGGVRAALNPLHAFDKASFKSFVEKPLFDPARRLPPPPPPFVARAAPAAAPPPPEPPPNVHLLGLVQGKLDLAIIGQDGDPKTQMLSSGDHIGNWEVTVLPTVGMRLRNGDRVVDYALFEKGNAPAPSPMADPDGLRPPPPPMAARNARLQRQTY